MPVRVVVVERRCVSTESTLSPKWSLHRPEQLVSEQQVLRGGGGAFGRTLLTSPPEAASLLKRWGGVGERCRPDQ